MFDDKPNETQYFYTDNDLSGAPINGSRNYSITFAAGQEPPVEGFPPPGRSRSQRASLLSSQPAQALFIRHQEQDRSGMPTVP